MKNLVKIYTFANILLFITAIVVNFIFVNVLVFNILVFMIFIVSLIIFLLFVQKNISKIDDLVKVAESLSNGDFNVLIDYNFSDKSMINNLAISLTLLRDTLKRILKDIDNLSILHERGDIYRVIDHESYRGLYKTVALSISNMGTNYRHMTEDLITSLTSMANGNFEVRLKQYSGDKKKLNDSIELLNSNLKEINSQIITLIGNLNVGNLKYKIKTEDFDGGWKILLTGLNDISSSFTNPLKQMNVTLNTISKGSLTTHMEGSYEGEFKEIQDSINNTVDQLHKYIEDINNALTEVAKNNLNVKIDSLDQTLSREENNDIREIKEAINNIIQKFADILKSIRTSSNLIDDGTKILSLNAENLSNSAMEGETTLNDLLANISSSVNSNVEKAQTTLEISHDLEKSSVKNVNQMGEIVSSMESIDKSSKSIINIIKLVEDISFQTNLLALNASVEAARAGEHGRGFAVVAEEVRSLSTKTTELTEDIKTAIDVSTSQIKQGMDIVTLANSSLNEMVSKINDIKEISEDSLSKAEDIVNISERFNEISTIIQGNTLTSKILHEKSSELEELSYSLKRIVLDFILE